MNDQLFIYSILNEKFYEDYSEKLVNNEFYNIVLPKVNDSWKIERNSVFLYVHCNRCLPSQGWKIHLSATLKNAKQVLDIALDILIKNKIIFKLLVDLETFKLTSQKSYPRQSFGKFITIYPKDVEEFKHIIGELYDSLKEFEGPYILSDKRYLDCKVIYYRYGGILPNFKYDSEGKAIHMIIDGYGREVEDSRLPYFSLPEGIDDVYCENVNDSSSILMEKYDIIRVVKFTNSGGVYLAKSKLDDQFVIVKEARPYTMSVNEDIDAVYIRKEELKRLKELFYTGFVPGVIDAFYDWEHFFIVEEYIEGYTLDDLVVGNNPFPRFGTGDQVTEYMISILNIFIKIADFLSIVHENSMIYSDLSLENIMITPTFDVKIIDLEGCVHEDSTVYRTVTKGFYDSIETKNLYASDIYGFGCLLFSCILKKTNMLDIQPSVIEIFLNSIYEEYCMPIELKTLILEMTSDDVKSRPSINEVKYRLENILSDLVAIPILKRNIEFNIEDLENKLITSIRLGVRGIGSAKHKTSISIFPNTPILSSKMNISTGLSGIVRGLNYVGDSSQNQFFLNAINIVSDTEPMGLYVGKAGIIWTLLEIGELDRAQELFHKWILRSQIENDYSIFSGVSGVGQLCIKLYLSTNNIDYLKLAINYGEEIILNLRPDNVKYLGYKNGLSGISLFLLYLHIVTKVDSYLSFGKEILLRELNYLVRYDSFSTIDFPGDKESNIASPYFIEGTSGILSVVIRYYNYLGHSELGNVAIELADSLYFKYTISPTLFKGLAGIGNTLLDCYYILRNEKYRKIAFTMARECLQHEIKYEDGVLYPDLYISKLSTDFGYGTTGILMFFERLLKDEKKNFCLFLDELLIYESEDNK